MPDFTQLLPEIGHVANGDILFAIAGAGRVEIQVASKLPEVPDDVRVYPLASAGSGVVAFVDYDSLRWDLKLGGWLSNRLHAVAVGDFVEVEGSFASSSDDDLSRARGGYVSKLMTVEAANAAYAA